MKDSSDKYQFIINNIILLMPTVFSWMIMASFVLIFSFDMISFIRTNEILPPITHIRAFDDFILMAIWGIPTGVTVSFTGMFIDKNPKYIGKLVLLSMLGSSIFLVLDMIALLLSNGILVVLTTAIFGLFMGIQIISGHTLYGSQIKWINRGKAYSSAIFVFLIISLGFILICEFSSLDFFFPLIVIAIFGIIGSIVFLYSTNKWEFWEKDPWPTKLTKILTRRTNLGYFWTHSIIWLMFGLMIGSLAQAGSTYFNSTEQSFGIELDVYKVFWGLVFLGSLITIIPSGFFTDKIGRKTPIIIAIYGIVFASIIIGLLEMSNAIYLISTILLGVSFSLIHPSLDGSLWVDLTPRDSIGRYSSLGFQSFGLGFIIGFAISYWIFLQTEIALVINVFILIGLAFLASFPLFYISDSFPPLDFFLLLVINDAGMPIFHHNFGKKDLKIDLSLIAGALSAVSSFMLEATGEKGASLNLVRHGTYFILAESSNSGISAAVFANKNDPELQKLVENFLDRFERKFLNQISTWTGRTNAFSEAINDAEEIFGPVSSIRV